jgi:hypothetical protein
MDLVDLTKEIDKLNRETIPLFHKEIEGLKQGFHELLDRLNGATATVTVNIPEKKS